MELSERIAAMLEEKFQQDELFQDCFTVDIELRPGNRLNVFIDADSGIDFEKCKKISRHLEAQLDEKAWLGEKYVLEVSSPGLSRPLKFLRQYLKNIGRLVEVSTKDNRLSGTLISANEQEIVLEYTVIEREGKKKKTVTVQTPIPFEQIEKTLVKVVF